MSNARSRIEEFIGRVPLVGEDIRTLIRFAQRLEIDPYDVPAERDSIGEWHCIVGESVSIPGYTLGVSFRIADAHRLVEVISFYGWSGSLLAMAVLLIAIAILRVGEPWIVALLLVVAVGAISFGRIRVTADRSGLQVRYGIFGWPCMSVPINRIATARAIDIRPAQWGGWGYRGSLKLARRAAVVLRAGPGIRVDLHDGRVFAVTIDDPDQPARLLNAEVSRLAVAGTHSP